jgi:SAM-dependent methyltransferase
MQLATRRASYGGVRTISSRLGLPSFVPSFQDTRGFTGLVPQEVRPNSDFSFPQMLNPCQATTKEVSTGDKCSQPPETTADPSEKWKEITVDMWRDAVYTNQTYFGELISDTTEFVKTIAEHIKLGGRRVSLVEVGCGTGEFVRAAADDFRTVVGVDFNKEFIDFCKDNVVPRNIAKSRYLQGDACHLYDLLKAEFPKAPKRGSRGIEFWDDTRVVACVGNTIGIIPDELRPSVYEQMAEVAGSDGVLVMVYWNARWFGDACLNFYHANPKLCGPFEGESVDFKNTTLTTPMKYKTKWTSVDEARNVMEGLGMEIIALREKGKGVFVAARRF